MWLHFFLFFLLGDQMLRILPLSSWVFSGPRGWYIGNSMDKKMLQAFLDQQTFFFQTLSFPLRPPPPTPPAPLIGILPVQKKLFFPDFSRIHVCICSKFRTVKFVLDLSRFLKSEKRVKIYCIDVHHRYYLYISTNTLVNICCNFHKYVSCQNMPTLVYQLRVW